MAIERKKLADWRKVRGDMTQMQLAVKAEMSLSAVAGIEHGRQHPSFAAMQKIAHALGVEAWQIIWPDTVKRYPSHEQRKGD